MRITTNGQVTIPKAIREELGLLPHTEVEFVLEGDSARLRKAKVKRAESRGAQVIRRLRETGPLTMTTDEIMKLTRND